MSLPLRAPRRFQQRGVTLLEALIVLAFFGTVGSLVTLAVSAVSAGARAKVKAALGFAPPSPPIVAALPSVDAFESERATTEVRAAVLRDVVRFWLEGQDSSACPAVEQLAGVDLFDPALGGVDAWGSPFEISCQSDSDAFVYSAGPDRVLGTGDDLVVPNALTLVELPSRLPSPLRLRFAARLERRGRRS
jgi:hypothetical protein